MKIKWMIEPREVPGIGLMESGDVREIPDALAEALIKQKQAKAVIKPKKEED